MERIRIWENEKYFLSVDIEFDPQYTSAPYVIVWYDMIEVFDSGIDTFKVWDAVNNMMHSAGAEWYGDDERHGAWYVAYINIAPNVAVDLLKQFVGERGRHSQGFTIDSWWYQKKN